MSASLGEFLKKYPCLSSSSDQLNQNFYGWSLGISSFHPISTHETEMCSQH